jgi:Spy/CpxP family protein refolding chaperone
MSTFAGDACSGTENAGSVGNHPTWAHTLPRRDFHASTEHSSKIPVEEEEHRFMSRLMSRNARRTLLLAGVLAVSSCALWAQNDAPPAGQMRGRGGNPERELQQLTQRLSLTPDQQTQVKGLLAERRQKMEELRKASAGTDASAQGAPPNRDQVMAIRSATDTKINSLLNDDQRTKFAAWQQERKARMQQRQQGGDAPPPGI